MLRTALSVILSCVLVLGGYTAHAGALRMVPGLGTFSVAKLAKAGIKDIRTVKNEAGELVYEMVDEGGKVLRKFAFSQANRDQLREFMPSKLNRMLRGAGHISVNKMKEFPFEVFTFFVALGAVNAGNLIFNYNENPLATQQFLQSQASPLGQISFGSFMIANGLVTEPLMAIVKSNKLRPFIPYLGMSVGLMASNITHEIGAHVPGMVQCVTSGFAESVCDTAFADWVSMHYYNEKFNEWMPGLAAMILTTVISGTGEQLLKAGASAVIRFVAIQLALSFTPAGWAVRGATWTYKVAQLAGFTVLNTWLEEPMVFMWKNAVQIGPQLNSSDRNLGVLMATKLITGWKSESASNVTGYPVCADEKATRCYKDLDLEINAFQEVMGKWREANMASVLTAHGNWAQYLYQLSWEYRVAKQFYFDFVSDLRKKRYGYDPSIHYVHLMDRPLPLFGINPKGMTDEDKTDFLTKPNQVQQMQLETVADVVQAVQRNQQKITEVLSYTTPKEREIFSKILDGLATGNPDQIGKAVLLLRAQFGEISTASDVLKTMLQPIFVALGNPDPQMAPGAGYLKILTQHPTNQMYQKDPYPSNRGPFATPTAVEHLVTYMFVGPDVEAGEKAFHNNMSGFPSTFTPPMIRQPGKLDVVIKPGLQTFAYKSIFDVNYAVDGKPVGTMFDLLRGDGVRPHIVGEKDQTSSMSDWWEKYVEEGMREAWLVYEDKYEDIVQDLYHKLFRSESTLKDTGSFMYVVKKAFTSEGTSFSNVSSFSNGILEALDQERSIYLYILDTYLKSEQKKTTTAPRKDLNYSVLAAAASGLSGTLEPWTTQMIQEWQQARDLFKKLEEKPVRTKDGTKQFIVSRLTNKTAKEEYDKLEKLVGTFPVELDKVDEFKKKILSAALAGLKKTQEELLNYAQIINNVSYVETFEGQSLSEPTKRRCIAAPTKFGSPQAVNDALKDCVK